MISVSKDSLKMARTSLLMRQKDLAALSGVSTVTITRCENGEPVTLLTAQYLLAGLNKKRAAQQLPPLELTDIDWNISEK